MNQELKLKKKYENFENILNNYINGNHENFKNYIRKMNKKTIFDFLDYLRGNKELEKIMEKIDFETYKELEKIIFYLSQYI